MTHGRRPASKDPSHVIVMRSGAKPATAITVTLTGTVGSYAAMREVVDAVWQAPGVDRVVDHLVVGAVSALA